MAKESINGFYRSNDPSEYFGRVAALYKEYPKSNRDNGSEIAFVSKTTTPQLPSQTNQYRGKVRGDVPTICTYVLHGNSGSTIIVSPQGVVIWGFQNQREESLNALEKMTGIKLELKK